MACEHSMPKAELLNTLSLGGWWTLNLDALLGNGDLQNLLLITCKGSIMEMRLQQHSALGTLIPLAQPSFPFLLFTYMSDFEAFAAIEVAQDVEVEGSCGRLRMTLCPWHLMTLASLLPFCGAARTPPRSTWLHRSEQHTLAALNEDVYQEALTLQDDEITTLGPEDYKNETFIRGSQAHVAHVPQKFIWDMFASLEGNACPVKEKMGLRKRVVDSGKWVCGVKTYLQKPGCIVYGFGSNGQTEFEEDIVQKTHCEVHIFDPTLSMEQQQLVESNLHFKFHAYGLAPEGEDGVGTVKRGSRDMQLPLKSLSAIMRELHHGWVDVLKLDIEGAEWGTIQSWIKSYTQLPFTQLQVEWHDFNSHSDVKHPEQPPPRTMIVILRELLRKNLRIFNVEPNYWWDNPATDFTEFAYIQVDNMGNVVMRGSAEKQQGKGANSPNASGSANQVDEVQDMQPQTGDGLSHESMGQILAEIEAPINNTDADELQLSPGVKILQ